MKKENNNDIRYNETLVEPQKKERKMWLRVNKLLKVQNISCETIAGRSKIIKSEVVRIE